MLAAVGILALAESVIDQLAIFGGPTFGASLPTMKRMAVKEGGGAIKVGRHELAPQGVERVVVLSATTPGEGECYPATQPDYARIESIRFISRLLGPSRSEAPIASSIVL